MSEAGNLEPKSKNATVGAARIAAAQFGVVSREELLDCGFSASAIYRRVNSGELVEMFPRIYRFASAPQDQIQEIFAAVKWAGKGALASHNSAARVWQFDGTWATTLEVSTNRNIDCQT